MIRAVRHRDTDAPAWDAFVRASRNGTFLLERGFMDYHADRFEDHSLLLVRDDDTLLALLPGNRSGDTLHSHAGLSYAGFVYGAGTGAADALAMLDAVLAHMRDERLATLHYKTIPWIYHRQPAEDDRYALFRAGAALARRDVLAVVPREGRLPMQARRRRGARDAARSGIAVGESKDFAGFWPLLRGVLQARHGVEPVHALEEIALLHARFPAQVRLFTAALDGEAVAGVVVFETDRVAHAQYICAAPAGRDAGALDALFAHLLEDVFRDKPYFDFGISNEAAGTVLNTGLVAHKEGFGARAVVHDHYLLRSDAST